jgi:hypothetical protein
VKKKHAAAKKMEKFIGLAKPAFPNLCASSTQKIFGEQSYKF